MLFVSCSKRLQLVKLCLAMTERNFSSHVPAVSDVLQSRDERSDMLQLLVSPSCAPSCTMMAAWGP